jgi:hypothetical protein
MQVVLRTNALEKSSTKALPEHQAVAASIADCQAAVNRALADNIDTVSVMESILGEALLPHTICATVYTTLCACTSYMSVLSTRLLDSRERS